MRNMSLLAMRHWTEEHLRQRAALDELSDDVEAGRIAHDIGMSASELRSLVAKGPKAAQLLDTRIHELGLDESDMTNAGPKTISNMQLLCALCKHRRRCHDDLEGAIKSDDWLDYCPNALTLQALSEAHPETPKPAPTAC